MALGCGTEAKMTEICDGGTGWMELVFSEIQKFMGEEDLRAEFRSLVDKCEGPRALDDGDCGHRRNWRMPALGQALSVLVFLHQP